MGNGPTNATDPTGLYAAPPDSVSQTVEQAILRGNIELLKQLLKDSGQFMTAEVKAAAEAAVARAAAAEAAKAAAAIAAREIAAAEAAQAARVGTQAGYNSIMRAFFNHGFKPVFNKVSLQAMRNYQKIATNNIAKLQRLLKQNPKNAANLQKGIARQQSRLKQIEEWLAENGAEGGVQR